MPNSFMKLVVTILNSTENLLYEKVQDMILYTIRNQTSKSIHKSILSIYPVLHIVNR